MKFINGWTKETVIKHIEDNFKGKAMQSIGLTYTCSYLTRDGKKCAVGLFIENGHPAQKYQRVASDLIKNFPDLNDSMPFIDKLDEFQSFHDIGNASTISQDNRTDEEVLMDLISYIESES